MQYLGKPLINTDDRKWDALFDSAPFGISDQMSRQCKEKRPYFNYFIGDDECNKLCRHNPINRTRSFCCNETVCSSFHDKDSVNCF